MAPTLLVIADIGGYTRFMREQRTALAHAQVVIALLLEAVIEGCVGLELVKLEGDAAFFRSRGAPDGSTSRLPEVVASAHARFSERKLDMIARRTCSCDACSHMEALRLKFVAHLGEVARQRVKGHVELAGLDVILVHRMLKNRVPLTDYLLVTDPVLGRLSPESRSLAGRIDHDFDGFGPTATHYWPIAADPSPPPGATPAQKLLARLMLGVMTFPVQLRGWWRGQG